MKSKVNLEPITCSSVPTYIPSTAKPPAGPHPQRPKNPARASERDCAQTRVTLRAIDHLASAQEQPGKIEPGGLPGSVLCTGNTLRHGQCYRGVVEHCAFPDRGRELKCSAANIARNRQIETERGVGTD